ncbi:DNA-binding protein [Natronolimnohabitans sp. A-GB9]|uniref:PPC domain-containing DNA-binding protein n=1 Tax=Natronolimnohabitans sp. A-GB9 TaxID=3069757 RepID=UPI0027B38418|nr:PPC domain-containing DNA-binding protein [Natronolimnohabitans sp. A-GB9]MDQ2050357.1 DNA-binding protein [Natronolimnohabitans sp. A-GB9]
MNYRAVETESEYVARLETGADWRAEIESLASEVEADAAWFTALGAVQDAELWFYDQTECEYYPIEFDEPLEVASCVGNVSWLDVSESDTENSETEYERFAHTHAVLSDDEGTTYAGHLNEATVWAGELYMRVFEDGLEREYDDTTELDLWL